MHLVCRVGRVPLAFCSCITKNRCIPRMFSLFARYDEKHRNTVATYSLRLPAHISLLHSYLRGDVQSKMTSRWQFTYTPSEYHVQLRLASIPSLSPLLKRGCERQRRVLDAASNTRARHVFACKKCVCMFKSL